MYMIFGTFLIAGMIHVFLLFPESCGRTLEDMEYVFTQSIWQFNTDPPPSNLEDGIQNAVHELQEKADLDVAMVENTKV
jgi:hypothetical protein